MKFLAVLALVGCAYAVPSCDECKEATGILKDHLLGEESQAEQIGILTETVCAAAPDPAECESTLNMYYGEISNVLFSTYLDGDFACGKLEYCPARSLVKEWTCDECLDALGRLGAFMGEQSTIDEAIALLQGDAYCGDGGSHSDDCAGLIASFLPAGMPVLASVLQEKAEEFCTNLLGAC